MPEYLIAFNDEWVPDHAVDELRDKSKAVRALVAEMKAAGSSSSPAAWTTPPRCSVSTPRAARHCSPTAVRRDEGGART